MSVMSLRNEPSVIIDPVDRLMKIISEFLKRRSEYVNEWM